MQKIENMPRLFFFFLIVLKQHAWYWPCKSIPNTFFFLWFSVLGFLRLFMYFWMHTRTGRGLFLFVWIQKKCKIVSVIIDSDSFHFCLWNISCDVMCFSSTGRLVNYITKSIAKNPLNMKMKKIEKLLKKRQSNERCIRLALFKSTQDDKDHIGS